MFMSIWYSVFSMYPSEFLCFRRKHPHILSIVAYSNTTNSVFDAFVFICLTKRQIKLFTGSVARVVALTTSALWNTVFSESAM